MGRPREVERDLWDDAPDELRVYDGPPDPWERRRWRRRRVAWLRANGHTSELLHELRRTFTEYRAVG